MQDRHLDREKYFREQIATTKNYVLPLLYQCKSIDENTSILEIGCGEGGNLMPFLELGCKTVIGIDLSKRKIDYANNFYANHPKRENIKFISADIFDIKDLGKFDLIITRDVLEHIHGQAWFMEFVKKFMKPTAIFFLGFPPWHNPFGGHQQMCDSKILSKTPFFHILPKPIYKLILKTFNESSAKIDGLLEIKETGITIDRFEKILRDTAYKKLLVRHYFINPNYETKFGLKPRKQLKLISSFPYLRNFLVSASYYIVSLNESV